MRAGTCKLAFEKHSKLDPFLSLKDDLRLHRRLFLHWKKRLVMLACKFQFLLAAHVNTDPWNNMAAHLLSSSQSAQPPRLETTSDLTQSLRMDKQSTMIVATWIELAVY